MDYEHTQHGYLHYLFITVAIACAVGAWHCRAEPPAVYICLALVFVFTLVTALFYSLTVSDEGDHLLVRFGPLPLLSKRIPYGQITAVEPGRSDVLDGWGVHYIPRRGMIYNLWGFDCVRISLGEKTIRVGTDDVDGLVGLLRTKATQHQPDD